MPSNPPPFVVFATPRSGTAWLANLLTYGGWHACHEHSVNLRTIADATSALSVPMTGYVETGIAHHWRLVQRIAPEAKIGIVRRPIEECKASLRKFPISWDERSMDRVLSAANRKLDQIASRTGASQITYDALLHEPATAEVFVRSLGVPFDLSRWRSLTGVNVQCDFLHMMRHMAAHDAQIKSMVADAKAAQLTLLTANEKPRRDDLTLAQEDFRSAWIEAERISRRHGQEIGRGAEARDQMDVDTLQRVADLGNLVCTVARCNGRMVGYLLSVVGPDLGHTGREVGTDLSWYADPDFPGVGRSLKVSSNNALRERGVAAVTAIVAPWHDQRMNSLFKRMGYGKEYSAWRLELNPVDNGVAK